MILFVDACVREESRTRSLAECLLSTMDGEIETLRLSEVPFPAVEEEYLLRRDEKIAAGSLDDDLFAMARQFAAADTIVIAAPYWDLSFPATLKQYLEQINVLQITFRYTPEGVPEGLCRAKELYYVTTAGGDFAPDEYGFGYVKALAENYYGIRNVKRIKATGFDLVGAEPEKILEDAKKKILKTGWKE